MLRLSTDKSHVIRTLVVVVWYLIMQCEYHLEGKMAQHLGLVMSTVFAVKVPNFGKVYLKW